MSAGTAAGSSDGSKINKTETATGPGRLEATDTHDSQAAGGRSCRAERRRTGRGVALQRSSLSFLILFSPDPTIGRRLSLCPPMDWSGPAQFHSSRPSPTSPRLLRRRGGKWRRRNDGGGERGGEKVRGRISSRRRRPYLNSSSRVALGPKALTVIARRV